MSNGKLEQPDAFATSNFWDSLQRSIAAHEGLDLKVRILPTGEIDIGYGHNLASKGISKSQAKFLLETDAAAAVGPLLTMDWFNKLCNVRRIVLIEMSYNIGYAGLMEFKHMIAAIKAEDWVTAGVEMLASVWAGQVGNRAITLATMMQKGQIPIEHLNVMEGIEW